MTTSTSTPTTTTHPAAAIGREHAAEALAQATVAGRLARDLNGTTSVPQHPTQAHAEDLAARLGQTPRPVDLCEHTMAYEHAVADAIEADTDACLRAQDEPPSPRR